jgi:hypothetical protein
VKLIRRIRFSTLRMIVLAVASWAGFITFGIETCIDNAYVVSQPRFPVPATSETYPYSVKNTVVYITAAQHDFLHRLQWTEGILFAFIVFNLILNIWWPWTSKKKNN